MVVETNICSPMKCSQVQCDQVASVLYTWPGHDEKGVCKEHLPKLRAIATGLGMYLQVKPLP
jgi:hypothetical protein